MLIIEFIIYVEFHRSCISKQKFQENPLKVN